MADDDNCEAGSRATLLNKDDGRLQQYRTQRGLFNVTLLPSDSVSNKSMMAGGTGSVAFHNVSYEVVELKKCKKQPPRTIMYNVSGIMRTGLNVIMGPTGSGKTLLLDILADHRVRKGLTGNILINDFLQPQDYSYSSTYVVQLDVLTGSLTVRENLSYSAALRLSCKEEERSQKVDNVIEELELTHVADRKVGEVFIKGVSAEDRKRTNIGMELVISDGILFLDEPTDGLDEPSSIAIVRTLKNVSRDRVVVTSLRRAQYSMYNLFNTLTLLSRGRVVYHGPAGEMAVGHFRDIGYECERYDNPADFFLNVIHQVDSPGDSATSSLQDSTLVTAYNNSAHHQELDRELATMVGKAGTNQMKIPQFATNPFWQLNVMIIYYIKKLYRNPVKTLMHTIVLSAIALAMGIFYYQVDDDYTGFQNKVGAFYYIALIMLFSGLSQALWVKRDKLIFIHHVARGYYRTSLYLICYFCLDVIPPRIVAPIAFAIISYWMIGFKNVLSKFMIYVTTLVLTCLAGSTIVLSNAASQDNFTAVAGLTIGTFAFHMVTCGFLLNMNDIGIYFKWIQYVNPLRFTLHACFKTELKDAVFCDRIPNATLPDYSIGFGCDANRTVHGSDYLASLGYLDKDIWFDEMSLSLSILIPLVIIYITLLCCLKFKR
ncbi:broad substrate specificity ATP-binding cassette transporter ABCG2-like isoform X2 [Dysidea avara]